ncbi:MAG TPA: dipeptide/oligopeptide/nickel ABC transporter permease/ATP-binding protein [Natronosporangium sp.]|nr:dipeptide/oligopeptide/nickel ABC transporter permease/ATP-binding protein [Natronosporangium sp.]
MVRAQLLAAGRTPVGAVAAGLLLAFLVLAVVAPPLWQDAADRVDTAAMLQGPSSRHWLGTDALGRDVLLRVLVATRFSIGLALAATLISVVLGLVFGTLPTVLPRPAGRLVVAGINLAIAFPGLLLALFFAAVFGVGARGAVLAIGIAGAPAFARLVHTMSASVAGRDYVAAARVAGVGRTRLIARHVLPNIGEPLVVNATLAAGGGLLAFAGLSFLGLGVQPPAYDWGRLLGEGLGRIYLNPAAALAPGVAVVLASVAFQLGGEAVAQAVGLRTPLPRPAGPAPTTTVDVAGTGPAPTSATADGGDAGPPTGGAPQRPVLAVEDLRVSFPTASRWVHPVDGVSVTVAPGESVGIVGESGSGKTLTALAAAGLVPGPGVVTAARLEVAGVRVLGRSERELRRLLGTSLAMVFQDPSSSLNPSMRVGRQLAEVATVHQGARRRAAWAQAVDRLRQVRVGAPERRARQYPHEFSGGMRQRAMIAMGLMGTPALVIADEPTTALDVTVQREVLRLLRRVQRDAGAALLLISHDITVVSQLCRRLLVMYAGRVVEDLPAAGLAHARHPYTRALVASVPDLDTDRERPLATIPGRPPEPVAGRTGCAFAPRCRYATGQCRTRDPHLVTRSDGHAVACWHPREDP